MMFQILFHSSYVLNSVIFSFNIWKNNIVPSLLPFFIISELLINYGFVEFVGEIFKPIMNLFFKARGVTSFIFIMSIVSGFPSSAKYVRELYLQNIIDENEATKLLMFCHFSNPLFILGSVSIMFLNNKEVGVLLLICHYIPNIIIGLLFRNYYPTSEKLSGIDFKSANLNMHKKRISNDKNFGQIITNSLVNSINTLLLILGTVTTFLIITTIIDNNINLSSFYQSILNGLFEMTQGLKYVSILSIPLKIKCVLSVMIISFGGFSVHMQVVSIISDTRIKYFPFLFARVIHAFLSAIMMYFLFDIWINFI